MKGIAAILLVCAILAPPQSIALSLGGATVAKANIILDNDGEDDIDNASALRILNNLSISGAINVVGFVASDSDPYNASAARAYQIFQNISYPIYAYQGPCCTSGAANHYTQAVTTAFNPGDSRANYIECEAGYRLLLGNAANASVTIVLDGGSICIDELLNSPANYNSDGLGTGLSLITTKVKQVIYGAGAWSSGTNDFNFGFNTGPTSQDLLANWPSTVPFIFYGVDLTTTSMTGPVTCPTSAIDPYQYAFFIAGTCTRESWDETPIYLAAYGQRGLFSMTGSLGSAAYDAPSKGNAWTSSPGPFSYMSLDVSQSYINGVLCAAERIQGTNWC